MSRSTDEQKYQKKAAASQKQNKRSTKRFISFHPTKDEKQYLREQEDTLEDVLTGIEKHIREGMKLTVGYSDQNNAFFCSLRENHVDWQQARAISAWHAESGMAIRSLCFGVTVRYPNFPDLPVTETDYDVDW